MSRHTQANNRATVPRRASREHVLVAPRHRLFAFLLFLCTSLGPATAASVEIVNDPATGGAGKFAADEIRREATAKGLSLGGDAKATRIALTVDMGARAIAQSDSIRVQNEGGRRIISVRGADAPGAMYGGLDIAEAIRTGALETLRDSHHKPHIAQRGIKFKVLMDDFLIMELRCKE